MKRIVDIFGAGLGLLILSPLILCLAWMIRRRLGSPVLFRQVRPGLQGRPFEMIKFRTMRDESCRPPPPIDGIPAALFARAGPPP